MIYGLIMKSRLNGLSNADKFIDITYLSFIKHSIVNGMFVTEMMTVLHKNNHQQMTIIYK